MNPRKQSVTISSLAFLSLATFATDCTRQVRLPLGDNRPVEENVLGEGGVTREGVAGVDISGVADSGVARECQMTNLTRRCRCRQDGKIVFGRQTCDGMGRWRQCECAEIPETIIEADSAINEPAENKGNVTFNWDEGVSTEGNCVAGVYVGAFNCELKWDTLPVGFVTGPVSFTLEQSPSGEFLVIQDGTLDGQTDSGLSFTSRLTGSLDCSTDLFHAEVAEGSYGIPPFVFGTFDGTLDAPLDRDTQTLTGAWSLYDELMPTMPCEGPWNAVRQP